MIEHIDQGELREVREEREAIKLTYTEPVEAHLDDPVVGKYELYAAVRSGVLEPTDTGEPLGIFLFQRKECIEVIHAYLVHFRWDIMRLCLGAICETMGLTQRNTGEVGLVKDFINGFIDDISEPRDPAKINMLTEEEQFFRSLNTAQRRHYEGVIKAKEKADL